MFYSSLFLCSLKLSSALTPLLLCKYSLARMSATSPGWEIVLPFTFKTILHCVLLCWIAWIFFQSVEEIVFAEILDTKAGSTIFLCSENSLPCFGLCLL